MEVFIFLGKIMFVSQLKQSLERSYLEERAVNASAQCVLCQVRCHCIFSGPGIRSTVTYFVSHVLDSGYSDIFWHIL